MRKAVLLSLSVAVTAALMAGCASKPAQTQTSAAQTQEAQTRRRSVGGAKEESKETEAKADDGKVYELRTSSNQAQSGTIGACPGVFLQDSGGEIRGKDQDHG